MSWRAPPSGQDPSPAEAAPSSDPLTKGVETLLGDPKQAILRLSLPMIAAFSIQTIYNFVDAIWVSGLGADALAAVGFFFPFYFMSLAIGMGLGVGGGAAISRRIGAQDRSGANRVATHSLVLMALLATAVAIPFTLLATPIFEAIGAGRTVDFAVAYARVMFGGTFIIFFPSVANAILRAEGDATRAMYAMAFGAVLNIVLDPIFIYVFGLGVAGAAWATVLAMAATSLLMANWMFLRRDTYVSFSFRGFRFERAALRDIFGVGLPASVMFLTMSFMIFVMNLIIVGVGGTDGVAVFATGWRVVTLATLPTIGIATAVTSVCGAAYGARDFPKLRTAYLYALRLGLLIMVPAAVAIFVAAPVVSLAFTWTPDSARIGPDLVLFLQISVVSYPAVAFGPASASMFQGVGKGLSALGVTLIRTLLLMPPLAALFAIPLGWGLPGAWWGIVVGSAIGGAVAFLWARGYIQGRLAAGSADLARDETPVQAS